MTQLRIRSLALAVVVMAGSLLTGAPAEAVVRKSFVKVIANPIVVSSGEATTIAWRSNLSGCVASGGFSGSVPSSGSQTTGPLTTDTTYTITCKGPRRSESDSVVVKVNVPLPKIEFSADSKTVASGGSSTLIWSSSYANTCTASGAWAGSKTTSGTETLTGLTTTGTYTLTCTGAGGSVSENTTITVTAPPPPPPAPTVTISANPTTVTSGGSSTLSWSSTGATSCTASGAWTGSKATSGTQSLTGLTSTGTYTLTCTGAGGSADAAATITVNAAPQPTVTISADPTVVNSGGSSSLTWHATYADSCTASGAWSGAKATSDRQTITNITSTGTYTLTCAGAGGSADATATITVIAPTNPTVTILANPTSVDSGGSSTLTWHASNADACTATGAWSGSKVTSGTQTISSIIADGTYTLSCTNASGGAASASATITVNAQPQPTATISANPTSVDAGGSSTLTWSSTNADSCTASGAWSGNKATSGSETISNITASGDYVLTCTNSVESNNASANVLVNSSFAEIPNTLTVSSSSGKEETNYPLQFGRPFRLGEISTSPQVLLDGTPLATQADIKTRHADGSVKFAVISVVLPALSTTERTLTFRNQAAPSTTPVSIASMLADYDFEATIDVKAAGSSLAGAPVSARSMLSALTDAALAAETNSGGTGPRYWTSGPINTTVLLHDHTTKAYDIGTNGTKAIRPMFQVQFWPTIGKYYVRHIIESGDVTKLKDETALEVTFTTGFSSPTVQLSKTAFNMYAGTWQSRAYWGGAAIPRPNIKHGVAYLADTGVMPNYDASIVMDASALDSYKTNWQSKSKNFLDAGYWQKAMSTTGGRPDLGIIPKWDAVALFSGAAHMHEIGERHAEFAGSWAFFFREGDAKKTIYDSDSGIGRVISKLSRPSVHLYDGNYYINTAGASDKFIIDGTLNTSRDGWSHDHAHTPGMFWFQYLTTGEAFWQEKLLQLAAWSQFVTNPGLSYNSIGNGRANTDLVMNGVQPRGYGWQIRNRGRAWWAAVDGSPEKKLFEKSMLDAVAMRSGIYDLPGVLVGNPVRDAWNTNYAAWYQGTPVNGRPNPLGYMDRKGGYTAAQLTGSIGTPPPDDWDGGAMAPWMQNFVAISLWHTVELGFEEARPLAEFSTKLPILILNSSEPRHVADYVLPDVKNDGYFYRSLEDLYDGYQHNADGSSPSSMPASSSGGFAGAGAVGTYNVSFEGYGSIAAAAVAMANAAEGQDSAWKVIEPWQASTFYYNHDPRYAILPRTK